MSRKPRIMMVNEFSLLSTGFGTYGLNLLKELHARGYQVCEVASYVLDNDPRIMQIPWKVYGALPQNDQEKEIFNRDQQSNQFGKWKFTDAVLDFKPDVVFSIRDPWFDSWINPHPFRKFFNMIWMPTVDSEPMRAEWMDDLKQCDRLLTYTQYGKRILETQSGGKLQVFGVPSAGVETEIFKPALSKTGAKDKLGLEPDTIVFGTVMRSQPRKFYPELFKSFVKYLDLCRANGREDLANKSYLYCHTGIIDVGWNLSLEIKRHKLSHKVLFTYTCRNCGFTRPLFFSGEVTFCPHCQKQAMMTPGSAQGVSREQLGQIMSAMDVYVQVASNEGLGMPILEAKSCGVPTIVVDYSAMTDLAHEPGGIPAKVATIFQEPLHSTYQLRAYPDNDDIAQKMYGVATMTPEDREKLGLEGRAYVEKRYNWGHVTDIWEQCINSLPVRDEKETWLSPPKILGGKFDVPPNLSNEQFLAYLWGAVVKEPSKFDSGITRKLIESLNMGYEVVNSGTGQMMQQEVNRGTVINWFIQYINNQNAAEQYRYNRLLGKPSGQRMVVEV